MALMGAANGAGRSLAGRSAMGTRHNPLRSGAEDDGREVFYSITSVGGFYNRTNPVILDLRSEAEECRGAMAGR